MQQSRVALFFSLLLVLGVFSSFAASGEWSTFHRELGRDGHLADGAGPANPAIAWSFETGDYVYSSPILYDGKVYVGSGDHSFYCLDALTGELYWSFPTADVIQGTATINDGWVYLPSYDGNLYCLDAETGVEKWSFPTGGDIFSSPGVDSGLVVFGCSDTQVYCLDAGDGSQQWNFPTTASVWASPSIEGGRVYIGSGSLFYCLELNSGSLIWSSLLGETIISTAAVQNEEIYIATLGNNLGGAVYLLDGRNGQVLWLYQEPDGGGFFSSPAISERMVVIGSDTGKVTKLERDSGAFHWEFETGGAVSSSPAIANDKVYVGSADGGVYCLDLESGLEHWRVMTEDVVYSSPCVQDGYLWVGSWDRNLYCLGQPAGQTEPFAVTVELLEPSLENMSADRSFAIRWELSVVDPGDTVTLYYASEKNESQKQVLVENLSAELQGLYLWDSSDVPEGSYWVMVELVSGKVVIKDWSEGTIQVRHPEDEDSEDSFVPGFGLLELVVLVGVLVLVRKRN